MSPYRVHAAPPDLLEVALATARRPPRIVALRGIIVVGFVGTVLATVASIVALGPAPGPSQFDSHLRADPHRFTAARGATVTGLNKKEEEALMREYGMYDLLMRNCPPEASTLDTSNIHRQD